MKSIMAIIFIFVSLFSTKKEVSSISKYNPNQNVLNLNKELAFWENKLNTLPNTSLYNLQLANTSSSLYNVTGEIKHLLNAENNFKLVIERNGLEKSSALISLAQNMVTQHRFCEAYDYILEAAYIGKDMRKVNLVRYDIESELGINNDELLHELSAIYDIQYIIRKAKSEDANGNLYKAIALLENALEYANNAKNNSLIIWTSTNLAEFYGHNGQIEKSRKLLKSVLTMDESNWYAMKLLAWIAYAHDKDYSKAIEYLDKVSDHRITPELSLMYAEISESMKLDHNYYSKFLEETKSETYGNMYNSYHVEILLKGKDSDKSKALEIAKQEVINRTTPETYDLLSYAYFINGFKSRAIEISKTHVLERTEEPKVLFHQLFINKEDNELRAALSNELKGTKFELGPIKYAQINNI